MKRSLMVTLAFACLVVVSLGFTRDEPKYKNLKVLPKNITKVQMDSVMHHFSLSLGVKCNFCHVRNEDTKTFDFASDGNKHKLAARNMMKMTTKINKKYFDVTKNAGLDAKLMVTCYSCHHGSNEPAVKPMAMPQQQRPMPMDSTKRQ